MRLASVRFVSRIHQYQLQSRATGPTKKEPDKAHGVTLMMMRHFSGRQQPTFGGVCGSQTLVKLCGMQCTVHASLPLCSADTSTHIQPQLFGPLDSYVPLENHVFVQAVWECIPA